MIQIKKTLLTLVALLAVTTGAWALPATPNSIVINGTPQVGDKSISLTYHFDPNNVSGITSYVPTLKVKCAADNKWDEMNLSLHEVSSGTTNISLNTLGEFEAGKTYEVCFAYYNGTWVDDVFQSFVPAASAASGPEVAWDKTTKTGTFTMPGGNVTLEPEYYPQATLATAPTAADGAKATTDDLLVSGGTVATITGSDPAAPQGTLMYYVSLTNMSTEALLALDADKWVAEPTAAGITQKCGAFVYYYVKGNDSTDDALNFSDGDISSANVLNVPIYPAPLWNAEFDLTNAPEEDKAGKWSTDIPEGGVVKGTPVTVTYTGDRKVIGVKAEKKAAAPAETTVTLTTGEIGDLTSWGSNSKTINGITIAVSGDAHFFTTGLMDVTAFDPETGEPISTTGTYTFTSSVGKIKRIDINHNGGKWWGSGDGWPGSYQVYHSSTFTWSGTPAASVTLNGSCNDMDNCTFDVSSFVFTLEPTN